MLTEVIGKLDRAVLELALVNAFYDMCFYEGEEIIDSLEKYFGDIKTGKNTEEDDQAFFEFSMPYIENSVMVYGAGLFEGLKEGGRNGKFDAADSKGKVGLVAAEKTKLILGKDSKEVYESELTEAEEAAIWEGVSKIIIESAKVGIEKSQKAVSNISDPLSKATKGGILASAKTFKKHFKGFSVPEGKAAVASPEKKKK